MMQTYPIKKFGTKLMVSSKAVNTIPDEYMSYARNARIYDGGIWPRRGKQLLTDSTIGTNNKGWFVMNGALYQIANSKIYQVDTVTGTQTEKATLWYDAMTDILVYGSNIAIITSNGQEIAVFNGSSVSLPATVPSTSLGTATITIASPAVVTLANHGLAAWDAVYFTTTGALPTGLSASTKYYVISAGLTANDFEVSATKGGSAINTSWVQSGTHTLFHYKNTGFLEYCRGFSFVTNENTLYISRPITPANPEFSYDFTGSGSQQITYDTTIRGLKATMNGIYIFTDDQAHFIGANSLQNVAGSATFISTPLGNSSYPMSNLCIASSGDKIFYVTKNLQVQTINYMQGTAFSAIGELSARPIVNIKEFLNTLDTDQPNAFAHYNETDKTIQFQLRSVGSPFNDYVLVYDLINDTWNVDTNKNYNYLVKFNDTYYGFSDVNTSIYADDTGFSDAGMPIEFRIDTQNMNQGTPNQKIYGWLYVMGGMGLLSSVQVTASIDSEQVFQDEVSGNANNIPDLGEIGWWAIGDDPIGGDLLFRSKLVPFDRRANEGRIYQWGKRIQLSFESHSQIQEFVLDSAWIYFVPTTFIDQDEVW